MWLFRHNNCPPAVACVCVPVGRTLLWEEVRKRKLLGFGTWEGGGNLWEEVESDEARVRPHLDRDGALLEARTLSQGASVNSLCSTNSNNFERISGDD